MNNQEYRQILLEKMNAFTNHVFKMTKTLHYRENVVRDQLRKAALSVTLNYVEGYARKRPAVQLNFFEISYGSLKEAEYLISFAKEQQIISASANQVCSSLADQIGAMLWTQIASLEKHVKKQRRSR